MPTKQVIVLLSSACSDIHPILKMGRSRIDVDAATIKARAPLEATQDRLFITPPPNQWTNGRRYREARRGTATSIQYLESNRLILCYPTQEDRFVIKAVEFVIEDTIFILLHSAARVIWHNNTYWRSYDHIV
jgi:hypothetical protein